MLQLLHGRRERCLFFSFSDTDNIPGAGRESTSRGEREGERETAASVTDKSVAQLVRLTAPWAGGEGRQVQQSFKQGAASSTHKLTLTHSLTHSDHPAPGELHRGG